MSLKTKEKIFPKIDDMNNLEYDIEGLYSISHPNDADIISNIILDYLKKSDINIDIDNIKILDGTAGLGGNVISFSRNFKSVVAIEINNERFKMLKNNIGLYNLENVKLLNDDCITHLENSNYDVYFFDPPWGGPNYKYEQNIELSLGGMGLHNIVKIIEKGKIIVFKVPFNYNLNLLKDYDLIIKKIRNILIILLISS